MLLDEFALELKLLLDVGLAYLLNLVLELIDGVLLEIVLLDQQDKEFFEEFEGS